jgi:arsenite methyltransferase
LGLGCGNPQAIAALRPGERVLDLGSGAGFDVFLAARQVGPTGFVIGVDMTPEMVQRARRNAQKAGVERVDFRLGEIEHVPVESSSVDVIMSNCVINLSPDKAAVFREAFRVLAPGGRLAISDVVATAELPPELARDAAAYTGCISGASPVADLERLIADAGFMNVRIAVREDGRDLVDGWQPGASAGRFVASALIEATKPAWSRRLSEPVRWRAPFRCLAQNARGARSRPIAPVVSAWSASTPPPRGGDAPAVLQIGGELVRQIAAPNPVDGCGQIVLDSNELDGNASIQIDDGVAGAPVSVLRLTDRAGINEQDVVDEFRVRLVGVSKDDDIGIRRRGETLKAGDRTILEQVFVDLARAPMNQENSLAIDRDPEFAVE